MAEQTPDPVERLAQVVRDAQAPLSDMRRARGEQALVERLRREANSPVVQVAPAPAGHRLRRNVLWWSAGLAATAAAAAALILLLPRREPSVVHIPGSESQPDLAAPLPQLPADEGALAILRPLNQPGNGVGNSRLETRPGQEIRAWLADCGHVVLRGGSVVVVEQNDLCGIALRVERGTLLVSFDHDTGRSLTVRTRDALVRVTGTVFAVSAGEGPTRVSVSRGSVEVAAAGLPVSVTAGKSWLVGAASLSAPDAATALALRELRALDTPHTGAGALRPVRVAEVEPPPRSPPGAAIAEDAEPIYRAAEKALSEGRSEPARELLETLVASHPRAPLVASARYELGRLAFAAKDYRRAREQLQAVCGSRQPAAARFHEPASFLLCRSELALGERKAALLCLERFRVAFPDSPHDGEAEALIATLR